jgi:hypothetical protein
METKHFVYIGAAIGGTAGGYLGAILDHGNYFGLWAILLSAVGGLLGIYIAYKIATN